MTGDSEKIRKWERASEIVGFVMSFISMCFTIRLMRSFATDNTEYWLYMAFGATVQIAQICLFVYAVYLNWHGQNGKALTAFILFCLLFILSLAGTLGSFIVSNKTQNNQELTQDMRLIDMQKRAESIDRQIERSQDLIEGYQSKKLLTKGAIPEGKRLDRLNAERAKLSEEMANYKAEGTSDSLYVGLSKLLGGEPEDIKIGLFTLYAIALDLVSAVLLAFSIGLFDRKKAESEKLHRQDAGNTEYHEPYKTPEPAFQMTEKRPETAELQNLEKAPVRYSTETAEKQKQGIGFIQKSETQSGKSAGVVSPDVIKAYVQAAWRGQDKPDTLLGRRAIGDKIGIRNDETDHIHRLLKRKKIVEIKGNRTIPRMSMAEALARIA